MVEFVGRRVVAKHIAAVVGEPKLPGLRFPVEADAVPHTAGKDFLATAIGIHTQYIDIPLRIGFADVAWRAYRYVKFSVRTESDELPAMVGLARQPVSQGHGSSRMVSEPLCRR